MRSIGLSRVIFVRIIFSQIALKDIFAILKICNKGMIYLHQYYIKIFPTQCFYRFLSILIGRLVK